ncbi:MAG: AI-2E family transporter [Candidatus Promineofilum sp.]|nr:AI-2E family transporter [Promineifilum sp.]
MVEPMIPNNSPPWSRTTKTIVVVSALLLLALLVMRFRTLLAMLVVAAILAYLIDPLIVFIDKRTSIRRGIVIAIVYIILAAALIGGFFALGVASYQQAANLIEELPALIENVAASIAVLVNRTEPIAFGPLSLDPSVVAWDRLPEQLLGLVEPLLSQSGSVVSRFATSTVRTVFNLFFIFVLSIYLATDLPRFGGYVKSFAQQPGYREDAERLMPQLRHVWSAYLRGQIILSLVIFLTVWIGLTLLGVQNSLALGLLAGLLEFLPNLGPVISAGVTVLVAFFQPGNYLGLDSWQYALVVLALMIIIQQLENHLLVPRIVGGALDLHPIIVIVGLFMGASLAGILGAILAAPLIASLKLFGTYAWRKLFDLPPFPDEEPIDDPPPHHFLPE